jgi:hypothetical protein
LGAHTHAHAHAHPYPGSALFKYYKYTRACTKGYYLEQACTKCTYKRHIAIKQEVDIHEAGDKAIEKYM